MSENDPVGPAVVAQLPIPARLLFAYAAQPETVGIYAAVARLVILTRAPVPLSADDLAAWVGASATSATRTRALRALQTLRDDGWLLSTVTPGQKHQLLPTWGSGRDRIPRPWDFDRPGRGRPASCPTFRVPATIIDAALGTLRPRSRGPAVVQWLYTQPLLDLRDIGTYILCHYSEHAPTPRLLHLGLSSATGVHLPCADDWLHAAAHGTLTTLSADAEPITVGLSPRGRYVCGQKVATPTITDPTLFLGARTGSGSGSESGSTWHAPDTGVSPHQSAARSVLPPPAERYATDEVMKPESNQTMTPPPHDLDGGGHWFSAEAQHPGIDQEVMSNHVQLNGARRISRGEWAELADLQHRHGVAALLAWQERALRVATPRVDGVHAGYYRQCAADAATHAAAPPRGRRRAQSQGTMAEEQPHGATQAQNSAAEPVRATQLAALEAALGTPIRRPALLADVDPTLIAAWTQVAGHPGLARWDDPVGYIISALTRHQPPPDVVELARWQRVVDSRPPHYDAAGAQERHAAAAALRAALAELLPAVWEPLIESLISVDVTATGVTVWCHHAPQYEALCALRPVVLDAITDLGWPTELLIEPPMVVPAASAVSLKGRIDGTAGDRARASAPAVTSVAQNSGEEPRIPPWVPQEIWVSLAQVVRVALAPGCVDADGQIVGINRVCVERLAPGLLHRLESDHQHRSAPLHLSPVTYALDEQPPARAVRPHAQEAAPSY